MASVRLIEYAEATAEVRAVYDDIMTTRKTDFVTNFWKAIAVHPPTLRRTFKKPRTHRRPGTSHRSTRPPCQPTASRVPSGEKLTVVPLVGWLVRVTSAPLVSVIVPVKSC